MSPIGIVMPPKADKMTSAATTLGQAVRNHSAGRHKVAGAIGFSAPAASLPPGKCGRHQCLTERLRFGRHVRFLPLAATQSARACEAPASRVIPPIGPAGIR